MTLYPWSTRDQINNRQSGLNTISLPKPNHSNTTTTIISSSSLANPRIPQKRKLSATDLDIEIPDSEDEGDEDYGWAEEDDVELPAMPPQTQGSEDILVPAPGELDGDDDAGNEEEGEDGFLGEVVDSEDELAL